MAKLRLDFRLLIAQNMLYWDIKKIIFWRITASLARFSRAGLQAIKAKTVNMAMYIIHLQSLFILSSKKR